MFFENEFGTTSPQTLLLQTDDVALIERTMSKVPDRLHQLLVLRELEGLSYRELADVVAIPIGTVMSRLSRAREALRDALDSKLKTVPHFGEDGPSSTGGRRGTCVSRVDQPKGTGSKR